MKQALIYARCASPYDYATHRQQNECKAFAEQNGFAVSDVITESGVAGRVSHRDGLNLLLKMAGARRFDALILSSINRISRNTHEAFAFLDAVVLCGVEIWSVKEGNYAEWRAAYVAQIQRIFEDFVREGAEAHATGE